MIESELLLHEYLNSPDSPKAQETTEKLLEMRNLFQNAWNTNNANRIAHIILYQWEDQTSYKTTPE